MPRRKKQRRCRRLEGERVFKPRSIPMGELETVTLRLDELEAMRLCDLDGRDQTGAGERMGVSRGTVQRLLRSGRAKVLRALVESHALVIERGAASEVVAVEAGERPDRPGGPDGPGGPDA